MVNMPKLTRRAIFPLAAVGATSAGHASISNIGLPGLAVTLVKHGGQWCVIVPAWGAMDNWWRPGMAVPTEFMPIIDYLSLLDETYRMDG